MAFASSTPSQTPRKQWTLYARRACFPSMKMDTRSAAESERCLVETLTVTALRAQTIFPALNRTMIPTWEHQPIAGRLLNTVPQSCGQGVMGLGVLRSSGQSQDAAPPWPSFNASAGGFVKRRSALQVRPLRRQLKGLKAWITGQRKDQSPGTRASVPVVQVDPVFEGQAGGQASLVKYNPLSNVSLAGSVEFPACHGVPPLLLQRALPHVL